MITVNILFLAIISIYGASPQENTLYTVQLLPGPNITKHNRNQVKMIGKNRPAIILTLYTLSCQYIPFDAFENMVFMGTHEIFSQNITMRMFVQSHFKQIFKYLYNKINLFFFKKCHSFYMREKSIFKKIQKSTFYLALLNDSIIADHYIFMHTIKLIIQKSILFIIVKFYETNTAKFKKTVYTVEYFTYIKKKNDIYYHPNHTKYCVLKDFNFDKLNKIFANQIINSPIYIDLTFYICFYLSYIIENCLVNSFNIDASYCLDPHVEDDFKMQTFKKNFGKLFFESYKIKMSSLRETIIIYNMEYIYLYFNCSYNLNNKCLEHVYKNIEKVTKFIDEIKSQNLDNFDTLRQQNYNDLLFQSCIKHTKEAKDLNPNGILFVVNTWISIKLQNP